MVEVASVSGDAEADDTTANAVTINVASHVAEEAPKSDTAEAEPTAARTVAEAPAAIAAASGLIMIETDRSKVGEAPVVNEQPRLGRRPKPPRVIVAEPLQQVETGRSSPPPM